MRKRWRGLFWPGVIAGALGFVLSAGDWRVAAAAAAIFWLISIALHVEGFAAGWRYGAR